MGRWVRARLGSRCTWSSVAHRNTRAPTASRRPAPEEVNASAVQADGDDFELARLAHEGFGFLGLALRELRVVRAGLHARLQDGRHAEANSVEVHVRHGDRVEADE